MTEDSYLSEIRSCDAEIAECEQALNRLRAELAEAENAREGSKRFRSDFDRFIEKRKNYIKGSDMFSKVRCFSSFLKKAETLVNGYPYVQSRESIDEMDRRIAEKIRQLNEDIDYLRQELANLRAQKQMLNSDYNNYLNSLSEEQG